MLSGATASRLSRHAVLSSACCGRRRLLSWSACSSKQHLVWAGTVLDSTTPSFQKAPKDWLSAVGSGADVEQGISFTHLSASPTHSQVAYKTLKSEGLSKKSLPQYSDNADQPAGLSKVFAVGRNVYAELGAGYGSQEATWGMVGPGFEGEKGITHLATGLGTSWIVTGTDKGSNVYSFGNSSFGQLGQGQQSLVTSSSGEPQLQLYPAPKRVRFLEGDVEASDLVVQDIAVGMDHAIVLTRKRSDERQQVWTCGLNTDGQLGHGTDVVTSSTFLPLSDFVANSNDALVGVAAGADTSFAWTSSGRVFSFGNSEYGQALHGRAIDRIEKPLEATRDLPPEVGKVVSIRAGGSFSILLDEQGQVFTTGYGSIGHGSSTLSSLTPLLLPIPEPVSSIHAGLEYAVAVTRTQRLFVWGLDTPSGRLGLGPRMPYPSFMLASRFTYPERELRVYAPTEVRERGWGEGQRIVDVACGNEVMWVLTEDGEDEVGRWDAR